MSEALTTRYHFMLRCPRCGKRSETTSVARETTVNCGDCLMSDVEIVTMQIVKITEVSDG